MVKCGAVTGSPTDPLAQRRRLRTLAPLPLVVSPMAGGPSTADLVVAATAAGASAFLAGGYKSGPALAEEMSAVRAAGVEAFGVNLFVPGKPAGDPGAVAAYVTSLGPEADALGANVWIHRPGTTTTTRPSSRWSWPRRRPPSASPSESLHPM